METWRNEKVEKDRKFGENGEKIIALYLSLQGMEIIDGLEKDGKNSDYDLIMYSPKVDKNLMFEVKTDDYVSDDKDTGNIAIEISFKGNKSGLSVTKSDWWVYYMPNISSNNVWMMEVDKLKTLIKKNIDNLKVVMGGDDNQSKLILIPRKEYSRHFGIDTIKKKPLDE
tara:strand:- start:358 stop:864 length:507 start_codon:yes stop_codon:yes gene_type:complete